MLNDDGDNNQKTGSNLVTPVFILLSQFLVYSKNSFLPAESVFFISMQMVIGPTPPGTGVM